MLLSCSLMFNTQYFFSILDISALWKSQDTSTVLQFQGPCVCVKAARHVETVVRRISDQSRSAKWQSFWCALQPQTKQPLFFFSPTHSICCAHWATDRKLTLQTSIIQAQIWSQHDYWRYFCPTDKQLGTFEVLSFDYFRLLELQVWFFFTLCSLGQLVFQQNDFNLRYVCLAFCNIGFVEQCNKFSIPHHMLSKVPLVILWMWWAWTYFPCHRYIPVETKKTQPKQQIQ